MQNNSPTLLAQVANSILSVQHAAIDLVRGRARTDYQSQALREIAQRSAARSDISDHLPNLFADAMASRPGFMVELGVRTGESTFVLERVAAFWKVHLLSIDIDDCSQVCRYPLWHFVRTDDIEFSKKFHDWCRQNQIGPAIDFLFIDTSHIYEHTVQEIKHWFPLLSDRATVCFHDTNQQRIYHRKDGSLGLGWNNRGVIRALEEYLGKPIHEREDLVDVINGWVVRHQANCNGFTTLVRVGPSTAK